MDAKLCQVLKDGTVVDHGDCDTLRLMKVLRRRLGAVVMLETEKLVLEL